MPRDSLSWTLPDWLRSVRRRVAPPRSESLLPAETEAKARFEHADNARMRVIDLLRPILSGERCLLVTGYQDFLAGPGCR